MSDLILILGDTLFADLPGLPPGLPIWMREDRYLCTRVRHHQQKLVLVLSAMRHFRDELEAQSRQVFYEPLGSGEEDYFEALAACCLKLGTKTLYAYEPNDRFFAAQLHQFCEKNNVNLSLVDSPGFLTSAAEWEAYASQTKRRFMADFYARQRRRLKLLVDVDGKPVGGKWSFDAENRKPFPKGISLPSAGTEPPDACTQEVIELVRNEFPSHPGDAQHFMYPVTAKQSEKWLEDFVEDRLDEFGPYEDALSTLHRTGFHSVLTPVLNLGLVTPSQVISAVLRRHGRRPVPLPSLEGFIRQVIGWREFIRGMDRDYGALNFIGYVGEGDPPPATGKVMNGLSLHRKLNDCWYVGNTGLLPLDLVIARANRFGWANHIERLMVVGAAMLLCDVDPSEACRWFMEMFVDSADWVMMPNVYGMSLYADGGLFATKPYVSGSAYLRRMSDYPVGPWCQVWDGLYWRFVHRNHDWLAQNPRTALMAKSLDRMAPAVLAQHIAVAEGIIGKITSVGSE